MSENNTAINFFAIANGEPLPDETPKAAEVASGLAPAQGQVPVMRELRDSLDMHIPRLELVKFEAECNRLAAEANQIIIDGDVSQELAASLLGQIKQVAKAIEDKRKLLVAAPNGFVKNVNNLAKKLAAPLSLAEGTVKQKLLVHSREQEIKRLEAERKAREAAEAEQTRLADLAAKAKVELPPEVIAPEPAPVIEKPKAVRTEYGTTYEHREWKHRVVDPQAVPREFLMVDEKAIRAAVVAGKREIPGVEIYEEVSIRSRA